MPLNIKGINIPETIGEGEVVINGVAVDFIRVNGQQVWEKKVPAGSQTFNTNGTFTVPQGIHEVNICMVGGGGGAAHKHTSQGSAYGGKRGELIQTSVGVTPGEEIAVVIGAGGIGGAYPNGNGTDGSNSSFKTVIALGGAKSSYAGNNGSYLSPCDNNTYYDGTKSPSYYAYGGQAGPFGNAGDSNVCANANVNAPANSGAGGGGVICDNISGSPSGNGGSGKCIVSWS